jgi:hypothetical protein
MHDRNKIAEIGNGGRLQQNQKALAMHAPKRPHKIAAMHYQRAFSIAAKSRQRCGNCPVFRAAA